MSEQLAPEVVTKPGEGQQSVSPEPSKEPAPQSAEDRLAQIEKTNQRLLNESKEWKAKFQATKDEQDKKEKELLTQKEDWKKLLEKEREERESERNQSISFKRNALSKFLDAEIMKNAPDAQDVSLIKQSLPADVVNAFEEDNEIKFTGIKEGIEQIKKTKPFLFKATSIPQMVNGKPNANAKPSSAASNLSQLKTTEDIIAFWKANPQIK